jgi:hypothetical protein
LKTQPWFCDLCPLMKIERPVRLPGELGTE